MSPKATPATMPRPPKNKIKAPGSRLVYSVSSSTARGAFLKEKENILCTGLLARGMSFVAIKAILQSEGNPKGHKCAGCKQHIFQGEHKVTTKTDGIRKGMDYSDHHHWHRECLENSLVETTNEHSLGRWVRICWEQDLQPAF